MAIKANIHVKITAKTITIDPMPSPGPKYENAIFGHNIIERNIRNLVIFCICFF